MTREEQRQRLLTTLHNMGASRSFVEVCQMMPDKELVKVTKTIGNLVLSKYIAEAKIKQTAEIHHE